MTTYSRGDVVLVGFVFSEEVGKKLLLAASLVTGIFRTIKRTMIDRKLGAMPKPDIEAIDRELRRSLNL